MNSRDKIQMLARTMMEKHNYGLDFVKNDPGNDNFYDQFSGQFFKSNKATILAAELAVNRELNHCGQCSIRVYYNILGIPYKGEEYEWQICDEYTWVEFDHIYVDYESALPTYHLIVMLPEPFARKT